MIVILDLCGRNVPNSLNEFDQVVGLDSESNRTSTQSHPQGTDDGTNSSPKLSRGPSPETIQNPGGWILVSFVCVC